MSKIYLDILDKPRQDIFQQLGAFKNDGYLAGGTALALQINHRKSVDFDVFIYKAVDNVLRLKAKKIFGEVKFYIENSDQISFYTKTQISITFVWYYYKLLFPFVSTSYLPLASMADIAADKAHTIGRRALWRDYVDFYLLLNKQVITLEKIIHFAQKKFGGEFNAALFLEQLSYFKDLEVVPIEFIDMPPTPEEIKAFLEHEVEVYLKKVLP